MAHFPNAAQLTLLYARRGRVRQSGNRCLKCPCDAPLFYRGGPIHGPSSAAPTIANFDQRHVPGASAQTSAASAIGIGNRFTAFTSTTQAKGIYSAPPPTAARLGPGCLGFA